MTGANWAAKKPHFLLFINKRLVESAPLKRAIDDVYSSMLPKGAHPFVYLSLRLPPGCDTRIASSTRKRVLGPPARRVHVLGASGLPQRMALSWRDGTITTMT